MGLTFQNHDVVVTVDRDLTIEFTGWVTLAAWRVDGGLEGDWVAVPDAPGPLGHGLDLVCPAAPGRSGLHVHVPHEGGAVFVTPLVHGPGRLDRIIMTARLELDLGRGPATWLREGYQSWDYAGVHPRPVVDREEASGIDPDRSWWRALAVAPERSLGAGALTARRFVTAFRWRGDDLEIEQAGAPLGEPAVFSFREGRPEPLGLELADEVTRGETVAFMAGPDPLALAEDLADLAGRASEARHWEGFGLKGWASWYYYGPTITAAAHLDNSRRMRQRVDFPLSQIDDGWQEAYGDWSPRRDFAERGMAAVAADIEAEGCVPGLWVAPFMVWPDSRLAAEHPTWLLANRHPGQADRFALDASHPEARTWLEELGRTIRGWGYRLVKADFLFLGALEGDRHDPAMTGTETMRAGLVALQRGLGEDTFLLGCGLPMLPGVGLVDANRIGGDIGAPGVNRRTVGDPEDDVGPPLTSFFVYTAAARNACARHALHRRWYLADPDVLLLEPFTLEEARSILTFGALTGGPYFLSDKLAHLDEDRWALVAHPVLTHLAEGPGFRPVDLYARPDATGDDKFFSWGEAAPRLWVQHRFDGTVLALFNWGDEPWEGAASWEAAGVAPGDRWQVTDLWTGAPVEPVEGGVRVTVAPHDVALYWVGEGDGPA